MKKTISVLLLLLALLAVLAIGVSAYPARVVDDEDLLTDEEEAALTERLEQIREQYLFDLIIHTTRSFGGKSAQDYADDFFDYNGYGVGEKYDGAVLVVSITEGELYISSCGVGENMFNMHTVDPIFDAIIDDVRAKNYAAAFDTYITVSQRDYLDRVEEYKEQYHAGWEDDYDWDDDDPYDPYYPQRTFSAVSLPRFFVTAIIGLISALGGVSSMKGKLKTVRSKAEANEYVEYNSLNLNRSNDLFLYSNVAKVRIDHDTSSRSSGHGGYSSGSHHSSSGHSHSGGGRRI